MRTLLLATLLATSLLQAAAQAYDLSLGRYIQTPMPEDWYSEGFTRGHLNISRLMQDGFTRLQAVEIQNHMKDLLEAQPDYMALERAHLADELIAKHDTLVLKALEEAIGRVKAGQMESGFRPETLKPHEFYVAFDMDETLLTQWYASGSKGAAWRDLDGLVKDSILRPALIGPDYVSMTPGWEQAFADLMALPGCKGVLIFTAKEDAAAHAIIARLKVKGKPLKPLLKGVFTRNHLVRDSKNVTPSKDLRIIDESLQHVVLIDDNPARIFPNQYSNLREFPKYNPDAYLEAKMVSKNSARQRLIEGLMPTVVSEIREAADHSRQHGISFAEAYYPYSLGGSTELLYLLRLGHSLPDALSLLRSERELFEPEFFIPAPSP